MAIPAEAKRGFLLAAGVILAIYLGGLLIARLPQ
jgi:hypothetical protein